MAISALEKYFERKQKQEEELKALEEEARRELVKQISAAKEVLADLRQKHIELTGVDLDGKPPGSTRTRKPSSVSTPRTTGPKADIDDAKELENLLKSAPNHKLNRKGINDAGYNLKSAIEIAKLNPKKFGQEQNRAQGSVWLK